MSPPAATRRAVAVVLAVAGMLLHDEVTHLATLGAEAWGTDGLARRVWATTGAGALGAAALGAARAWRARRAVGLGAWLGGLLVAGMATWALVEIPTEVAHLPQYAAIAVVWGPGGGPAAAVLGLLDEAWQAGVLYPARGLDARDVALNAVAAALGGLWTWTGAPTGPGPGARGPDRPSSAP